MQVGSRTATRGQAVSVLRSCPDGPHVALTTIGRHIGKTASRVHKNRRGRPYSVSEQRVFLKRNSGIPWVTRTTPVGLSCSRKSAEGRKMSRLRLSVLDSIVPRGKKRRVSTTAASRNARLCTHR